MLDMQEVNLFLEDKYKFLDTINKLCEWCLKRVEETDDVDETAHYQKICDSERARYSDIKKCLGQLEKAVENLPPNVFFLKTTLEYCEEFFTIHTMQQINSEIFGRINSEGNVGIFFTKTGEAVTQLDSGFRPVGSSVSSRHEHPQGIILSRFDAKTCEIKIED